MASPTHSIASGRTTPSERIPQATFQKQHTNGKETNIQVVVRCRGRNDREQREGQAIVVDTPCVTGREIKVNSEVSRKYTFDRVFGPEATQETVYDDIVAPILKEVLDGYNCTIFAYGQTGTGKTYTMEGDLEDVEGYHAGIIPRTMDRLFQLLDPDVPEYSVKLSYSELYNEELRDLLSPFNDDRKLTIYKETSGLRRVIIQGLEEVTVASAQDGISWLKKGSKKRQVAATKCNENSSRSHAIFSITVHVKEMTLDGEEVLKVGKLNLVDLAGSESIGRSGAENKRAREAGNINKSLLTLGRVINALVDKAGHIPYRDSNLTRLLQDSLGGRTKTCIIATISPAKNAREETLSTLDYARRAKNIRNKPEVNQRMTKQMLIKEYIVEIDRLKAALLATQEKNGIYLAQRDYQQMVSDNSTYKERLAEQRKTIENIEAELRQAEEQFLQQMRLFNETKRILQVTEQNLKESRETLERTEIDLRNTKQNLTEQEVLTAAHAATEERLNTVALILGNTLKSVTSDVEQLHAKIGRKQRVEEQHMATASQIQSFVQMRTAELKTNTFDHMNRHSTLVNEHSTLIDEYAKNCKQMVGASLTEAEQNITRIDTQSKTMETEFIQHIDSMSTFVKDIRSIGGDLQQQALQRAEISRETFNALFNQLKSEVSKLQEQSKAHNATLHDNITSLYDLMAQQLKTQNDAFMSIISALSQEVVNEQRRSNKYLEQLNQIAKKEQETAREAQQAVISSVVQLLTNFTNGHEHSIQNMLTAVQDTHTQSSDERRAFVEEQVEIVTKANDNIETCRTELQDKLGMTTKQLDTIEQQTGTSIGHIHQAGDDVEMVVNDMQQQYLETIDANVNNMETKSVKANTQLDLFKEPHRVAIHDIVQHSQQGHTAWTRDMHRLDDTSVALTKDSTQKMNEIHTVTEQQSQTLVTQLDQTCNELDRLIVTGIQPDSSTGETPLKRNYQYPRKWQVTQPHDAILQKFRETGNIEQSIIPPNESEDLLQGDAIMSHQETSTLLSSPIPPSRNSTHPIEDNNDHLSSPHMADEATTSTTSSSWSPGMAERPNKRRRRPSPSYARLPPVESTISQQPDNMEISSPSSSPNSQGSRESDIIKENRMELPNVEQAISVTRRLQRIPRRSHSINSNKSNGKSSTQRAATTTATTTTRATRVTRALRHLGNSPDEMA